MMFNLEAISLQVLFFKVNFYFFVFRIVEY